MAAIAKLMVQYGHDFVKRLGTTFDLTPLISPSKSLAFNHVLADKPDRIVFDIDDRRYVGSRMAEVQSQAPATSCRGLVLASTKHTLWGPPDEQPSLFTRVYIPNQEKHNPKWLRKFVLTRFEHDDVFHKSFLEGIVVHTNGDFDDHMLQAWKHEIKSLGARWYKVLSNVTTIQTTEIGLHLWCQNSIWEVFRLYDDCRGAFMVALDLGLTSNSFQPLQVAGGTYQSLSVMVPSRLKVTETQRRPLEGLRMVVKDCWRMKGLRNTMENRAFYQVNQSSHETADLVTRLIDSGAIPVGMAKLSCFAGREEPVESIDYVLPFNPRGDGYQSPAGSSNGSAVAVAAYDWVDFGIGTDTTGSGRRPALVNGCFALRPSQNDISVRGIIPTFDRFDTVSLLARDMTLLSKVATCLLEDQGLQSENMSKKPRIVVPLDYFPVEDSRQMDMIESFVKDLEKTLSVPHEKISIKRTWNDLPPAKADNTTIDQFLDEVATKSFLYAFYHNFDDFRKRYGQKYGKKPFVTAFTQWRWDLASSITQAEHEDALSRLDIYREWFLDVVLDHDVSNTFMILPLADVKPHYRDDPLGPFAKQSALDALYIAPILRAPELVVPIGQLPYESRVSGCIEQLPVALSILGLPGTDISLMKSIQQCLKDSKRPQSVTTGRTAFIM